MARRNKRTWEQDLPLRLRFERGVVAYPGFTRRPIGSRKNARMAYGCTIEVDGYEIRRIEVCFSRVTRRPTAPDIYVDGPEDSPHRFAPRGKDPRRRLCVWYPDDQPERRWVSDDGLLSLIEMIRIHLFKEAYYRETGDWPGEEAPHGEPGSK